LASCRRVGVLKSGKSWDGRAAVASRAFSNAAGATANPSWREAVKVSADRMSDGANRFHACVIRWQHAASRMTTFTFRRSRKPYSACKGAWEARNFPTQPTESLD
jgi:hypothetical protein